MNDNNANEESFNDNEKRYRDKEAAEKRLIVSAIILNGLVRAGRTYNDGVVDESIRLANSLMNKVNK